MSTENKKIPVSVSDILLHAMVSEDKERIILPITRYNNVMNAPCVVKDSRSVMGAPFALLETDTEVLTTEQIRALSADII